MKRSRFGGLDLELKSRMRSLGEFESAAERIAVLMAATGSAAPDIVSVSVASDQKDQASGSGQPQHSARGTMA